MMAQPSSTNPEVAQPSHGGPGPSSFDGNSVSAIEQTALYENPGISMDWTADEQLKLEDGLKRYASEPTILRYAKIALHIRNKTVRDVALRCRWMIRKENSRRRKEDHNLTRKSKEKKEKTNVSSAVSSQVTSYMQAQGRLANGQEETNAISGNMGQLLRQNFNILNKISSNLAMHQFNDNLDLLWQARENILKMMDHCRNLPEMKNMPPLPVKVNEALANSLAFPIKNEIMIPPQLYTTLGPFS